MYYGEIKRPILLTASVCGCLCLSPVVPGIAKTASTRRPGAFDYGRPFTEETEEELLQALTPAYIQRADRAGR